MAINNYGYPMQQYSLYPQSYPTQQSSNGILWVQGEAGAKAYPVAPGNSVLLMDSESDCFYIKSTDATGIPSPLRKFSYSEVNNSQQPKEQVPAIDTSKFVTREEFEELKRLIQDRQQSRRDNRNNEQAFSRNTKQQQQQFNE